MNKGCKIKIILFVLTILLLPLCKAANGQKSIDNIIKDKRTIVAYRAGYDTSTFKIAELQATYLKAVLSFLGVVFLVLIIYGGFVWMKAQGNAEEAGKAKSIIINASIGLVIVLASYAISEYIIRNLVEAAT